MYYTALINVWSTTTLPANTSGTPLSGAMTTAQKLAAVNGWIVTGVVPTSISITGVQLANCINWTEFAALTPAQQQNLLLLCLQTGSLLGGTANTTHLLVGMILAYFTNASGPTILALTALAQGAMQPWWQANGYASPFNTNDLASAGGLT